MADRRLKVKEVATEVGISEGSVFNILHDHLHLSKVSARWVPRNLQVQDRQQRMQLSSQLLELYRRDPEDFHLRLVTGDETWVHHWDPESKIASMQWKHSDSPPPRKFRIQSSAGKVMASVFWDSKGLLLIDYLPIRSTITGAYYSDPMVNLRQAIKTKRRGMLTRGVLLLHDNAPVHKSRVAQATINQMGFEQLAHPPYSPDLAPSDFHLFRAMKSDLRGKRFGDDEELISAVDQWFNSQSQDFFHAGIAALEHRWSKCVEVRGDYIEK